MNAAPLTSPRLKRVQVYLRDGKLHSTMGIIRNAKVCAVSAIVSELRTHGLTIHCQRIHSVWYYRMVV